MLRPDGTFKSVEEIKNVLDAQKIDVTSKLAVMYPSPINHMPLQLRPKKLAVINIHRKSTKRL